jgi:PadR family transcriptional regulator, regulatory protein PadR
MPGATPSDDALRSGGVLASPLFRTTASLTSYIAHVGRSAMAREPRLTLHTQAVLAVLLSDMTADHYGLEISRKAELPSGTIYPILARLEKLGWVTSSWESVDPSAEGRPARRLYRLSELGAQRARQAQIDTMRRLALPGDLASGFGGVQA